MVLEATLYFDANTLLLRKMEGKELNLVVKHRKMRMSEKSRKLVEAFGMEAYDEVFNTEFHFVVNMTEDRGFLEVQSVAIDEEHVLYDKNIVTSSVLFNIGDRKTGRGVRLDMGNNMQEEIARQGYDAKFWEDNEVVLRTPVEEQVMRLFEGHQLFGVFK